MDAAFADVEPIVRVVELDRRQPEFTQTFWTYLDKRVTEERVASEAAGLLQSSMARCSPKSNGATAWLLASIVRERGLEPAAAYAGFLDVLAGDAERARKVLGLVRAQPGISSQVIDNLNGSIHLRALLTDLFLIDEILRPRASEAIPAAALAGEKPPPDPAST